MGNVRKIKKMMINASGKLGIKAMKQMLGKKTLSSLSLKTIITKKKRKKNAKTSK